MDYFPNRKVGPIMSGEYDTDTHFFTTPVRVFCGIFAGMLAVMAIGYGMCIGYVIRGNILWLIIAIVVGLAACAIFGGRSKPRMINDHASPAPVAYEPAIMVHKGQVVDYFGGPHPCD